MMTGKPVNTCTDENQNELGTRNSELGTRNSERGTRKTELGKLNSEN